MYRALTMGSMSTFLENINKVWYSFVTKTSFKGKDQKNLNATKQLVEVYNAFQDISEHFCKINS